MMNVANKKILVVGLGKSGVAASRLLLSKGARVWVTEKEENAELRELARNLIQCDAVVELGKHSRHFVEEAEIVVISPGVVPQCEVIGWAEEYEIPVISELELASWYVSYPLIAVTGTNGKSTVASLLEHIFRYSGKSVVACGNIGLPLSEVALQKHIFDLLIVEVSSFQLEYIHSFRPEVAVWLNFSLDHLDHHQSIEAYLKAKLNIFKNQGPGDWAVVHSEELDRVKKTVKGRMKKYGGCPHIFQENVLAAIAVAEIYGINLDRIESAIAHFQPLPHRLEYVATVRGIDFIDDSKGTNIASVIAALDSVEGPVVLILGGRDKGDDFTKLKESILAKVSSIIAIGEAQSKIWNQLKDIMPVERVLELDSAVKYAFQIASPGTTVLLSPGCSSFDMFRDYKERGEVFKKCVMSLGDMKEVCVAKE